MPRLLRPSAAAAAMLVAATSFLVPAHARGGDDIGDDLLSCEGVRRHDGWAAIPSPTYKVEDGDAVVVASAAPSLTERRVYVTNGTAIRMSNSAGCKWEYIFPNSDPRVPAPRLSTPVVTHLVAPTGNSLWAAMYDAHGDTRRPRVARTTNAAHQGGNTTAEPMSFFDDGLPLAGTPAGLVVDRDNVHAFLLVDQPVDVDAGRVETTRALYKMIEDEAVEGVTGSRLSWTRVALPPGFTTIDGMVKHPDFADGLWVWAGSKYAWTTDGGAKWTVRPARGPITALDINKQKLAAVFSRAADGGEMALVDTLTGQVRAVRGTPISPTFVVHGSLLGTYAIADKDKIFGYDASVRSWIDITPKKAPDFTDLHIGADANGRILLAETRNALFRFDLWPQELFVPPKKGVTVIRDPGVVPHSTAKPELTPERQVVTVRPGERVPAPVKLKVPPGANPLDVYFLVDTTLSMNEAIQGLRTGIRNIAQEVERRTAGQACFGLGEVKDFAPHWPQYGAASVTPYARKQEIKCEVSDLENSLRTLYEGGGDEYPEEAQTIALTQAVQGNGQPHPFVLPGQDAKFKAPTRVIVLITDIGFKTEPRFEGYPTIETTVRSLNAHYTKVVGIAVKTERNDVQMAVEDLSQVARGTNTLAPKDGVDCDGDGKAGPRDVAPNAPIVCLTENHAPDIAPAIVGVLLGVKEPASIGVDANDPHSVLAGVEVADSDRASTVTKEAGKTSSVSAVVNIRVENHLDVRPIVTCSKAQAGRDLPIKLSGLVRQAEVDTAEIIVRCSALPVVLPPPPPPPPPPPAPEVIIPVPKPQLLPAIVPQIQPPPPNNPPGNLNMNAGLSQEEEQQFQLAGVTQGAQEGEESAEEVELAMSALGDNDAAAANIAFGVAALGMTLAAGGAMAHRRRTQRRTAQVRVRV